MNKKVVVINTGGTISMEQDPLTKGVGNANPEKLTAVRSHIDIPVDLQPFSSKPSGHITLQDMYRLALQVNKVLAQESVSGVVITHGTDTLEETAFFLHLTIAHDKPVVVTGAMRSHNELGSDGVRNLVQAIRVANDPRAMGRGTIVVFHDEIHSADAVTKVHTHLPSAFQSPGKGPIGFLFKDKIDFYQPPQRQPLIPLTFPSADVMLIKAVADLDDRLIQFAIEQGFHGIVIEAFGQGNLPPSILPACKTAIEQKIPIFVVSRCINGEVEGTYDYIGGGKQLKEQGFIFCSGLQGQKARIQLILALSAQKHEPSYDPFF